MLHPAAGGSLLERGFLRSRSDVIEIGAEPGKIQKKQNDEDDVVLLFFMQRLKFQNIFTDKCSFRCSTVLHDMQLKLM